MSLNLKESELLCFHSISDAMSDLDSLSAEFEAYGMVLRALKDLSNFRDGDGDGEGNEDEMMLGNCHDTGPDDSMDGDFDSAMASAGHGTDEDYGGCDERY